MDAGGLAQMSPSTFASPAGLGMPSSGLSSRRGGQTIKPLSFDAARSIDRDGDEPTPRTSRINMLAGLRKGPKTSTATNYPASPTAAEMPSQPTMYGGRAGNMAGAAQDGGSSYYNLNGPKTAHPSFYSGGGGGAPKNNNMPMTGAQYTVDQVLAPPEILMDDQVQEGMDPAVYAQLVATNMYLAQQQQQLQHQLLQIQAATQQFQGMNMSGPQQQQQYAMFGQQQQQQQQLNNLQQQLAAQVMAAQQQQHKVYAYFDPATGQPTYYVDQGQPAQLSGNPYMESAMSQGFAYQQQQQPQQQYSSGMPRVQVSPAAEFSQQQQMFRTGTPPKRYDSPTEVVPLPPPSANAFRRGHKKIGSLANINSSGTSSAPGGGSGGGAADSLKSAGPKTAPFPQTPGGGYGPGQARAGEHPCRQPLNPPPIEELLAKPTSKHEGSKNFAARSRRSAVHNLVKAGMVRRNGTASSFGSGSMSPVSDSAEEAKEAGSPLTEESSSASSSDCDEQSGSGILVGEIVECSPPRSRSSASGAWGAIGSDRPSSRQKSRKSIDSMSSSSSSDQEGGSGTFATVFKTAAQRAAHDSASAEGQQRKAPMLVLTSGEKRKSGTTSPVDS